MMWLTVIIIWLFAPVVELGIIIALAVANDKRKRRIEELEKQLGTAAGLQAADIQRMAEEPQAERKPQMAEEPQAEWKPQMAEEPQATEMKPQAAGSQAAQPWVIGKKASASGAVSDDKRQWAERPGFSRGTAALVAGVVLVVLAGLIFATTAWHILPDICKAAFVLGFAALFFTASFLAERFLKIRRTGCAFYILGSVFLMLSVLAVGYFRLLGAEFVLVGYHRWRVLCAGSFVTTAALFGGCRKFQDKVYTCCCLWGVTVSVLLLMLALRLDYPGVACGMMYYGMALLVLRQAGKSRRLAAEDGGRYGAAVPDWHVVKNLDVFVPMHFGAVSLLLLPLLLSDYLAAFFRWGNIWWEGTFRIEFWALAAAGCLTAGMAVLAWNSRKRFLQILFQISCVIFFQYGALWLPVEFIYQISAGMILTGVYFLASRKFGWEDERLRCPQGDVIYTAVLAGGTVFLVMEAIVDGMYGVVTPEIQAAASAVMVLLAAVMAWWGSRYPAVRALIPVELFCLTATVPGLMEGLTGITLGTELVIWFYMLIMMIWDVGKRERFWAALTVLGAVCQMTYMEKEGQQIVLLLLFAGYFFCKCRQIHGNERNWMIRAAFVYFLECVYYLTAGLAPGQLVPMLPVFALLAFLAFLTFFTSGSGSTAGAEGLLAKDDWFWDTAAAVLFAAAMGQFLWGSGYALWNAGLLLVLFAALYLRFYRKDGLWKHLIITLSLLPLPFVLEDWYGVDRQVLYGGVLAVVLVTGTLMRRYGNLVELSEDGRRLQRADWFHMLIVLVLVPMMLDASKIWHFVYVLLLVLYVLQFAVLPKLRRTAVTAAELLLLYAWWSQPFFTLPDRLWLEIQMVPVFLIIRLLPAVWGESDAGRLVQRGLDMACLIVLTAGAFIRADVLNALILEGICLMVFLLSHLRKSVWWLRTSGIVMVLVALYMTRSFWLSISWWIYLLTAGLGLIGFAAWNEIRRRGKE